MNISASPTAVGAETKVCREELGLTAPENAAKTPVILVHGLWSKASNLNPLKESIETNSSLVVDSFNYGEKAADGDKSDRWVTEGDTAQRLAKTIVCYSRLYDDKEPVIVAHSMGGLLTRAALDWAAYGTRAKDVTGHVITIGTPHQGALLASGVDEFWVTLCKAPAGVFALTPDVDAMCRQLRTNEAVSGLRLDSEQLAKLPSFPSGVSVRAIAGNVSVDSCALWGCNAEPTNGDLVVPVVSATAEYTSNGNGDGKQVFACRIKSFEMLTAWCNHNNMLKAPQVQSDVKASIEQYIASAKSKPVASSPKPSVTGKAYDMFGMTLRLDPDWEVRGGDSNGWTVKTGEIYAGYYNPHFSVSDFSWLGNQSVGDGYNSDFGTCADEDHINPKAKLVRQGERRIGNKTATYYTAKLCTEGARHDELFRVWEVNAGGKKVVIHTTEWPRYSVTNLDGILASATWQ